MVATVERVHVGWVAVAGVGDLLRQRRAELGLTQEQLEEMSGVPQSTIAKIEAGRALHPRIDTLNKLGRVLDLSMDDFYRAMGWVIEEATVGEEIAVPDYGAVPVAVGLWVERVSRSETVDVPRCWVSAARSPLFVVRATDGVLAHGIMAGDVVVLETYVAGSSVPLGTLVLARVGDSHDLVPYDGANDSNILGTYYALLRQPRVAEG